MFDPDNDLDRIFVECVRQIAICQKHIAIAEKGQKEMLRMLGLSMAKIADALEKIVMAVESHPSI